MTLSKPSVNFQNPLLNISLVYLHFPLSGTVTAPAPPPRFFRLHYFRPNFGLISVPPPHPNQIPFRYLPPLLLPPLKPPNSPPPPQPSRCTADLAYYSLLGCVGGGGWGNQEMLSVHVVLFMSTSNSIIYKIIHTVYPTVITYPGPVLF